MSNKQFLELPESPTSFEELKDENGYFVDKTEFIKTVFTDSAKVLLFTRPRRFGKTLLMTMFESFLRINPEKPFDTSLQQKYFKGTKILEEKEFCTKFMGQYPVIEISLKDIDGNNYEEAYRKFAQIISKFASNFEYLLASPKLNKEDKDKLSKILKSSFLRQLKNSDYLTESLRTIATALYKEYGKYPILLIDEYDVPLANASFHDLQNAKENSDDKNFKADYHSKMVTIMKGFFGILKDKKTLTKTILTGCLKVAKNSLFTGVNNFTVNSVVDDEKKYTGLIGFTKDETNQFLKDYELDEYAPKVKENYDGYKFFDKEMFCPWDVVQFVRKNFEFKQDGDLNRIKAGNYWSGTTSDKSLSGYIGYLTDKDNQRMQDLVDGKAIGFQLNESMNYDCLSDHNSDDFWSLLLHSGYLTLDWEKTDEAELSKDHTTDKTVYVRIPNLEILGCFNNNIKNKFSSDFKDNNLHNKLVNALSSGNQKEVYDIIFDMLQKYVSIRDTATKAPLENYYHGFINGIFTCCEKLVSEYHSNYEAGNGYPDITFKSERNTKAVIIEIKATSNDEDMDELASDALSQIEENNYALPFTKQSKITGIYAYGLVFCKKDCLVVCKKLK